MIRSQLRYDKRAKSGFGGRALMTDVPQYNLVKGDRLEPTSWMIDVGEFDQISVFPCIVMFWRTTSETLAKHRNPLFNEKLGINPYRTLAIDPLHDIHLGVLLRFVTHVFWCLLLADVFKTRSGNKEERLKLGVSCLRGKLMTHYARRRAELKAQGKKYTTTELSQLTVKMLGTEMDPKLRAKAAQTVGLLPFVVELLKEHEKHIEFGSELLTAGLAIARFMEILKSNGRVLPHEATQEPSSINGPQLKGFPA
jgi:hypothetical protein